MSYNQLDLVILKTLITNKKYALDFSSEFDTTKQNFFSVETWNFANIVINYLKTYKELPTLRVISEKLTKGNNEKLIENISNVWKAVENTVYDEKEYKHDLEKMKKRFAEKQISSIQETLSKLNSGNMDISKAVGEMQKTIFNVKSLNQAKTFERKTLKEAIPIFREEYNAKQLDPTFDQGIKTGYSYLDHITDGARPGELILIGGESGGGKSMLLMNMALQMWMQKNTIDTDPEHFTPGNSILYFSLEMPFKPCLNRVLSRLSTNPSKLIRSAKLNNDEAEKLKKALRFINKFPSQFEIIDIPRGTTIETIERAYEDAKNFYDPKIIVVDYLGLMSYGDGSLEDWMMLGKISEQLHEFARVHNCIVLSAVQLNRAKTGKDPEDKIGLHRIGRSALIMQNANIGIQIETRQNEKQYPDMYYHVIKNRDGENGKGKLIKNLACALLLDEKIDEDTTEFFDRDPDDISDKIALLDI